MILVILTYRQEPKEYIISKDTSKIIQDAPIVRRCCKVRIRFDPLLAILNGRVLFGDQPEVKEEETGDNQTEGGRQQVGCDQVVGQSGVYQVVMLEEGREERPGREDEEGDCDGAVEQHVHEVLVVVETDAVGYPRAMVIHFEDALIALGAVMATVGLFIVQQ